MQGVITAAVLLIAVAAAVFLYRTYVERRDRLALQRQVFHSLDMSNDPETPWVEILAKARQQMTTDEYEKFEKGILKLVENIGIANQSGLTSQADRMKLFAELARASASSPSDAQQSVAADRREDAPPAER